MQGENNYENKGSGLISGSKSTSDKVEYKMLLITLKNNMQKDIIATYRQTKKPVFIIYQTVANMENKRASYWYGTIGSVIMKKMI